MQRQHRWIRRAVVVVAIAAIGVGVTSVRDGLAAQGDCSQPVTTGASPTASDCLFILRAAVGSAVCDPECICAPKGSLPITATDALICLQRAVGGSPPLNCPCGITTTSTSTTTSTIPPMGNANIIIQNNDGAGEGFNDPSPRSPVGGNNGTTLGEQRLNVFEFAANLLEQIISSPVDILVAATFDELFCTSTGAVLGSAGSSNFFRDFQGAPVANTWFPAPLADKLRGADLDPGQPDIIAQFNSAIGTTCSFPNVWYYGLDGNPPAGEVDLATVVIHELLHGLGFATIVDLGSGQKGLGTGLDDVFMLNLEDHSTGKLYPNMTNAERVAASQDTGDLHWVGAAVVAGSGGLTAGRHPSGHVQMYAPSPQEPGSSVSHFDTALSPNEIMEPSYTGPLHTIGLARELFEDTFWDTLP